MLHIGHRDGEVRQAVDKVGSTINRVYAPQAVGAGIPAFLLLFRSHFLAYQRAVDNNFKAGFQRRLCRQIGLG